MRVRALVGIRYDGRRYAAGETIEMDPRHAIRHIAKERAVPLPATTKKPAPQPQEEPDVDLA